MEGVLPLSFAFGADDARLVGAEVRRSLIDVVRPGLGEIGSRLGALTRSLVGLGTDTFWLQSRSHVHLHQIIDAINALRGATINLAYSSSVVGGSHFVIMGAILDVLRGGITVLGGGAQTAILLAILAALQKGISFQGTFTLAIDAGSLGDFLEQLDLLKLLGLLGLLALALAMIVAFLYGVGMALSSFGVGAIAAAVAVGKLVVALTPLIEKLAGYDWKNLLAIGAGFLLIGLFIYALGDAFKTFRSDLGKIITPLDQFFTSISKLMDKFTGIDWKKLANIGIGFFLIGLFVYALGEAFNTFRADLDKIVAPLDQFFTSIGKLMDKLTAIDWKKLVNIGVGFLLIGLFVAGLGAAFNLFRSDLAKITGPLDQFFTSIGKLMDKLTAIDWTKLVNIGVGFLLIGLFVAGLGKAFDLFRSDLAKITGPLDQFFTSIGKLMDRLTAIDWTKLVNIGVGFLLIGLFVAGLGKAFNLFRSDLAKITGPLDQFFNSIGKLMDRLTAIDWTKLVNIGVGFLLIGLFVYGLGKAFNAFRSDLAKITGPLDQFFASIMGLMDRLTALDWGKLFQVGIGFLLIGLFVWGLGEAFNSFRDDLGEVLGPLDQFFQIIGALMDKFAGFSIGQMVAIAVGLLAVALFVYGLALALNSLNAQAIAAIPALVQMLGMLALLAGMFAAMTGGQLASMALGLLAVVVFVWLLAAALMFAAAPLASIATIFQSVATIIDQVTNLVKGFVELLSSIGSMISGLLGDGTKVEAKIEHATTVASDAKQTITNVPGTLKSASLGVPAMPAMPKMPTAPQLPANMAMPAMPANFAMPGAMPAAAPGLPTAGMAGLAPSAAGPQSVDQSVKVDGGINVNISAERLEADSARLLSDDIVQQLQRRLASLRSEQDFRVGARPAAPA